MAVGQRWIAYLNRPDGFDQLRLSLIPVFLDSLIHQFYIYGL